MIDIPKIPTLPPFLGDGWIQDTFKDLYPKPHSGTVLVLTARLEQELAWLI